MIEEVQNQPSSSWFVRLMACPWANLWVSLLAGMNGGMFGVLLMSGLLTFTTPNPRISGFGSVNREVIIREKAKEIAKAKLSDQELDTKLANLIELYEKALQDLMKEKQVFLFDGKALASQRVPDYTDEVRTRLNAKAGTTTSTPSITAQEGQER